MGKIENQIDRMAFQVTESDVGRTVLPYGKIYNLLFIQKVKCLI